MSYAQEIETKCNEIVAVTNVEIEQVANDVYNIYLYFKYKDKQLQQNIYFASDVWNDAGEIGIANYVSHILKLELEFCD